MYSLFFTIHKGDSLWPHGLCSPWNFPGQNTGLHSLPLLQGVLPTQGSNPGLLHYRQILYRLIHKRSARILVWVAYPLIPVDLSNARMKLGPSALQVDSLHWAIREALQFIVPKLGFPFPELGYERRKPVSAKLDWALMLGMPSIIFFQLSHLIHTEVPIRQDSEWTNWRSGLMSWCGFSLLFMVNSGRHSKSPWKGN